MSSNLRVSERFQDCRIVWICLIFLEEVSRNYLRHLRQFFHSSDLAQIIENSHRLWWHRRSLVSRNRGGGGFTRAWSRGASADFGKKSGFRGIGKISPPSFQNHACRGQASDFVAAHAAVFMATLELGGPMQKSHRRVSSGCSSRHGWFHLIAAGLCRAQVRD